MTQELEHFEKQDALEMPVLEEGENALTLEVPKLGTAVDIIGLVSGFNDEVANATGEVGQDVRSGVSRLENSNSLPDIRLMRRQIRRALISENEALINDLNKVRVLSKGGPEKFNLLLANLRKLTHFSKSLPQLSEDQVKNLWFKYSN